MPKDDRLAPHNRFHHDDLGQNKTEPKKNELKTSQEEKEGMKVLRLEDQEVPAMSYGYGPDGQSVQSADDGEIIWSDRVAWRQPC